VGPALGHFQFKGAGHLLDRARDADGFPAAIIDSVDLELCDAGGGVGCLAGRLLSDLCGID